MKQDDTSSMVMLKEYFPDDLEKINLGAATKNPIDSRRFSDQDERTFLRKFLLTVGWGTTLTNRYLFCKNSTSNFDRISS